MMPVITFLKSGQKFPRQSSEKYLSIHSSPLPDMFQDGKLKLELN
jgi:hypothetical protein